jgi:hypothetical protein
MTQAELANELDLSAAMVSKLKARGMPVHSVADAEAWRATNLDPCLVKSLRRPELMRSPEQRVQYAIARANERGQLAYDALGCAAWREFVRHVEGVRTALRTIPDTEDEQVLLPVEVWEALCGFPGRWSAHTHFERVN